MTTDPLALDRAGSDTTLYVNGLDGRTGRYLLPPLTAEQVAAAARGRPADPQHVRDLRDWKRRTQSGPSRVLPEGLDPKKLEEAGWGVVFPADADPEPFREALRPLLELRREQAARRHERYYREFSGEAGYRQGDSKTLFLARHGAGPGPVDPARVPYYLLLVGSPEAIPFTFQYQLDVPHAVGRLHFETLDEYARYAESVVAAETTRSKKPRRAVFFGAANPGDPATRLSARHLVHPLAESFARNAEGWEIETSVGEGATRARLGELLGHGAETSSLLFSACHGVGFPAGDPDQLAYQGALVCQDWPGPQGGGLTRDQWFGAEDVDDGARPAGLIAFFFACYGAGTPEWDDFSQQAGGERPPKSPHPFVAKLPQRLLGHPKGGALAVVGHVERAWDYSFLWEDTGSQIEVFKSALTRLLEGHPVGSAMEFFNQRYAELEATLSEEREAVGFGKILDEPYLLRLWAGARDARNYAVLGDPAVRIPGSHPEA